MKQVATAYNFLLGSTPKIEATCSSDTLTNFQRTTRRYMPEDTTLHSIRYENLESYWLLVRILMWAELVETLKRAYDEPYIPRGTKAPYQGFQFLFRVLFSISTANWLYLRLFFLYWIDSEYACTWHIQLIAVHLYYTSFKTLWRVLSCMIWRHEDW
jgi:hypothetical protein